MVPSVQRKLSDYVDEHEDLYRGNWQQLCIQLQTILLAEHRTNAQRRQDFLTLLQQRAVDAKALGASLVYGEMVVGATSTLLFYQHFDESAPTLQACMEMAALLSAIDACREIIGGLPVNIKWLLDCSEEQEITARSLEEHGALLQADAVIWSYTKEEGTGIDGSHPLVTLGARGLLSVELTIQMGNAAIDAMHGGIVPNALWRLIWALNSLKDAREDIKIEGFYDALVPASDDSTALLSHRKDEVLAQQLGTQRFLMNLQGFPLHYSHLLMPTCTLLAITGEPTQQGDAGILPRQARARVDFQLVPEQTPHDIFAKLRQHLDQRDFHDVQTHILRAMQPVTTSIEHSFIQSVVRATENAYGQAPYVLPMAAGSYPLYPLRMTSSSPIVLLPKEGQADSVDFAAKIKQLAAILIEGATYATDSTQ